MPEETLSQVNPEASSASRNFLKKGWEKLAITFRENKKSLFKSLIGGILLGSGAVLSTSLAPGLTTAFITGKILTGLSMSLGAGLLAPEFVKPFLYRK